LGRCEQRTLSRILIAKAGTYVGPTERLGDYDTWFRDLLTEAGAEPDVWIPHSGEDAPTNPIAVVITGSGASMTDVEPWIERLCNIVRAWHARGVPILGVCFGHQLLAAAFGGRVERHPAGREVGTVTIHLTDAGRADPLFAGVPATFRASATHADHVTALPPGAVVLARNEAVPVQAFAWGETVRGVQFHPEYDAVRLREDLRARGVGDEVLAGVTDAPEARRVVANFVRQFKDRCAWGRG
jgi:GMP synthase (glutamine-hydrolysing)